VVPTQTPKLASVFGEAGRHEGRRLLMSHADIPDPILTFAQRLDNGIDPVTDDPKAMRCAPRDQSFDHDIGGCQIGGEVWKRLRRNARGTPGTRRLVRSERLCGRCAGARGNEPGAGHLKKIASAKT
jgi:hypothetical protein